MVNVRLSEAITEILEILKNVDNELIEKLPQKFKDFLQENKSETYNPQFDYMKDLKDLKLKEETKNLLGIMYMNYWSEPEERKEYEKLLNENQIKYNLEIKQKYNPDNLFKKQMSNKGVSAEEKITKDAQLIKYNESLFRKIWNKILSIFKWKKYN